jgi:transposase
MALNERQEKVIQLYASGETITNIAKITGVSRNTIYTDLDSVDVKAGVDKCLTEMKNQAEKKISADLDLYITEFKKIALTGKSEKNRLDALQYILNRVYGTPTNKIADVTDAADKDSITSEQLEDEFSKFKVITDEVQYSIK